MSLKWIPKDPDKNIGVPGEGYINPADFNQTHLDAMIARAKNRKIDVNHFLINAGLKPVEAQLELEVEVNAHAEPKKRTRRTKAEIEADKVKE